METSNWITIGIAAMTIISGWGQFLVKEILLNKSHIPNDIWLKILTSKSFLSAIGMAGVLSGVSIWLLALEVSSESNLTRLSVFFISLLTVVSVLNIFLMQSLINLRTIAHLKIEIEQGKKQAIAMAMLF